MPLKKGKKKKKAADSSADPDTLMSDGTAKVKKKKLTKAEKDLIKLEKDAEVLKCSGESYLQFIYRMEKWIAQNLNKLMELFNTFDSENEGFLTYENFKSGMFDLCAPCNKVELHLLTKLLDKQNEEVVEYEELKNGLKFVREAWEPEEEEEDEEKQPEPVLIKTTRTVPRCICCQMQIWEPYKEPQPMYIELLMRLTTFEKYMQHPGHFSKTVHSHIPVYGIIQIIREETHTVSNNIAIFTDKTRSNEAMLPLDCTLEECGFRGGTYDQPEELLLYYDYKVDFIDCPILLCDHYFGKKKVKS